MMDPVAGALPSPYRLIRFVEIDSTNEEAKRRIESGHGEPALITAVEQTAGRGRRERAWQSPPGNIYATWMQKLGESPLQAARTGFILSLSIAEAVAHTVPHEIKVGVKWPNDVLAEGAKLAGILLEIAHDPGGAPWLISGFGVNVEHAPENTPYPATKVQAFAPKASVHDLLAEIANRYAGWHARYLAKGFAPVREAWLAKAVRLGEEITVNFPDGTQLSGIFETLTEEGVLLLNVEGEIKPVSAGDVYFRRAA